MAILLRAAGVAALLRHRRRQVAALGMRVGDTEVGRVIRERALGWKAAPLQAVHAFAHELGRRVRVYNRIDDNDAQGGRSEANEIGLG
jgi:hypothetical protein